MSSITTRPKSFDDLAYSSPYYNIIESNKRYYYNIYLENCEREHIQAKRFEDFQSKDVLESTGGSGAKFDVNDDGSVRYYMTQPGGAYTADNNGQFIKVTTPGKDGQPGTVNYVHYSQVFVPTNYVRQAMDVFAIVMAVTFQNTLLQMAKLEAYSLQAEKVNAKLSELNALYAQINLFQTQTQDTTSAYATVVTPPSLIKSLLANGILNNSSPLTTGVDNAPIYIEINVNGRTNDWATYNQLYVHRDAETSELKIGSTSILQDWVNDNSYPSAPLLNRVTSEEDILFFLSQATATELADYNISGGWLSRRDGSTPVYKTKLENGKYVPDTSQEVGKATWKGVTNHGQSKWTINPQNFALKESVDSILKANGHNGKSSYINVRDLASYADQVRIQIESENNQLQTTSSYISMANGDMQTNFNMATDVIAALSSQLLMTGKNIRI